MIITKKRGVAWSLYPTTLLKSCQFCQWLPGIANDILEHRCTGQDDYKQNDGRGLVIISNHAFKKLPMSSWNCQWLPGVANDILEYRCTGQDDHKQNKGRGSFIISNHALEKLPICQWLPGIANDILEHRCTGQEDHKRKQKQCCHLAFSFFIDMLIKNEKFEDNYCDV